MASQQNSKILEMLLKSKKFEHNALKECLSLAVRSNFIDIVGILLDYVDLSHEQDLALELLGASILHEQKMIMQMIVSTHFNWK